MSSNSLMEDFFYSEPVFIANKEQDLEYEKECIDNELIREKTVFDVTYNEEKMNIHFHVVVPEESKGMYVELYPLGQRQRLNYYSMFSLKHGEECTSSFTVKEEGMYEISLYEDKKIIDTKQIALTHVHMKMHEYEDKSGFDVELDQNIKSSFTVAVYNSYRPNFNNNKHIMCQKVFPNGVVKFKLPYGDSFRRIAGTYICCLYKQTSISQSAICLCQRIFTINE